MEGKNICNFFNSCHLFILQVAKKTYMLYQFFVFKFLLTSYIFLQYSSLDYCKESSGFQFGYLFYLPPKCSFDKYCHCFSYFMSEQEMTSEKNGLELKKKKTQGTTVE